MRISPLGIMPVTNEYANKRAVEQNNVSFGMRMRRWDLFHFKYYLKYESTILTPLLHVLGAVACGTIGAFALIGGTSCIQHRLKTITEPEVTKEYNDKSHTQTVEDLMNIFASKDSTGKAEISKVEYEQIERMANEKDSITYKFSPVWELPKREKLEKYYKELLNKYSIPVSNNGSPFTKNEEKLILDFMKVRAEKLK